ncbi:MAG: alkaline phytoceramidase [Proteobacteria bacterium]|nr:alkaline phytoceramidase [Pseudomonadota bacterium]
MRNWPAGARAALLLAVAAAVVIALFFYGRIPQIAGYNNFADTRSWWWLPNAQNVLSNLPFLLVGLWGLRRLPRFIISTRFERVVWAGFLLGVLLTFFGSAYYHWQPDNLRLVWDRLPITLSFICLFAAVLAERVSARLAAWSLLPMLVYAVASVIYWYLSETWGRGDLRPYILVQLLPLLLIPLLLLLHPPRYSHGWALLLVAGWYVLAKMFEVMDSTVYQFGGIVSGHAIKHLLAAVATVQVAWMLHRRRLHRPDRRMG